MMGLLRAKVKLGRSHGRCTVKKEPDMAGERVAKLDSLWKVSACRLPMAGGECGQGVLAGLLEKELPAFGC